ncbi:MAG: 3-phosphoserine/phosphohydroxythreonine transaminase [Gammaproteobacteria bacterium]|nr:MAG: 3-phosphoserine/phosphohydroxythreonine transaminase [Gammaproteobacteria bacterium]
MSRVYNFSAGPATLPEPVLRQVQEELLDWHGTGMSVMEMSHRGKAFRGIAEQAEADLRRLMGIPEDYRVLFLQGGATLQFAQVPLNLLPEGGSADYVVTGSWSKKALAEARRLGRVRVAASTEAEGFTTVPPQEGWEADPGAAYLHYTPNETIQGVEFHWVPDTGGVPLVADMSSTILSRPVEVGRFGLIYAGAQKNVGPAGLTLVIVREELLGRARPGIPSLLDYAVQAEAGSMYNTPPTFAWYVAGLVFRWLLDQGGLAAMAERNRRKAAKLYAAIDGSGFYRNPVDPTARSWMNVPFTLADPALDELFLREAEEAGLVNLKGHRSVGGMRASLYNAMPEEGVDALVQFMAEFERRHG